MKWGRPVCIEHEEPGLGASFERLVKARSFVQASELLEAGTSIPARVMNNEEAAWVGAQLPTNLRLDRDGEDYWLVSAEVPLQPQSDPDWVAKLGVVIHVMLPLVLFALFALFGTGCNPPRPDATWVNADAAQMAVLEIYTGRQPAPSRLASVFLVAPDPACASLGTAFVDHGLCVQAMTVNREDVYLVDWERRFSNSLPHELMHVLGADHAGLDWPADSDVGKQVALAKGWLLEHPSVDHIAEDPRQ